MWWWQRLEVGCPPETRSPWGDIRDAWNVIDSNRYLFTIRASRILMKFRQSKLTRLYTNCQILDSCQTGKYMIRFFKPFNQNSLFLPRDCGEDLGNQKWFNGWLTCPPWLFLKYFKNDLTDGSLVHYDYFWSITYHPCWVIKSGLIYFQTWSLLRNRLLIYNLNRVEWLWLSWQSGRHKHQRTGFASSHWHITLNIYWASAENNDLKEARNGPLVKFKNNNHVATCYAQLHLNGSCTEANAQLKLSRKRFSNFYFVWKSSNDDFYLKPTNQIRQSKEPFRRTLGGAIAELLHHNNVC